jgi:hypothetical protein
MIHYGVYRFGRKRVACRNAYCTTCDSSQFAEGYRSILVMHVFWIPLLPIGTDVSWFCARCGNTTDAKRPSRPFVLIAGMLCGVLLMFVGIMIGMTTVDGWNVGGGVALFGTTMAAGLFYLIKKQNYGRYAEAIRVVTPLSGESCPYCKTPLFAKLQPRCDSCRVNILTGQGTLR